MPATTHAPQVDVESPLSPGDLSPAELSRLHLARAGSIVLLHEMPDGRFFIHGPAVVTCPRCGNQFIGDTGEIRSLSSRHLAHVHDESHPMLPR